MSPFRMVALVFAVIAGKVLAQPPPPPPPPPPPEALGEATEAPPTAPKPNPAAADESRFRFGANAQLGWFYPQPMFTFGVEGRFGWSFNRLFALYGSLGAGSGLFFGGAASSTGASYSISVMSQWYVGAMAELNVGDLFFVAAGPGIGRFTLAGISQGFDTRGGAGQSVSALGGWTPSLDGRLGFGFGSRDAASGRRTGFTLALDVRAVFPTDSVYLQQGTGGQTIQVRRPGFGLVPMLMLGFDSR